MRLCGPPRERPGPACGNARSQTSWSKLPSCSLLMEAPQQVNVSAAFFRTNSPQASLPFVSRWAQSAWPDAPRFRTMELYNRLSSAGMKRLVECVPNFSEGRERVNAIAGAMSGVPGAWVLDLHADPDHNRSVVTLAGEPAPLLRAALCGVAKAIELIDLRRRS